VLTDAEPALVLTDQVLTWTTSGYRPPRARPSHGDVDVITPPASLAAITAGYGVQIGAGTGESRSAG
jgi:hypothetical protein